MFTRNELCYTFDPKEFHGEDFPGEIFRMEKEIRLNIMPQETLIR